MDIDLPLVEPSVIRGHLLGDASSYLFVIQRRAPQTRGRGKFLISTDPSTWSRIIYRSCYLRQLPMA